MMAQLMVLDCWGCFHALIAPCLGGRWRGVRAVDQNQFPIRAGNYAPYADLTSPKPFRLDIKAGNALKPAMPLHANFQVL
jgi:hypothetical protein